MSGRYTGKGAEEEEDPLVSLRRAMEDIADLVQGLTKLEAMPNEANLRNLGREMNKAKGSMIDVARAGPDAEPGPDSGG
jgi:hypothetical protein